MLDHEFESRVLAFERAWRLPTPPRIEDYLGDPFGSPSPRRERLLVELICIDLERRWQDPGAPGPMTLAGYVGRFPELISLDRLPVELIGEDYRARRRWGDRPSHEAFMRPFREGRERIRAELVRIDAEIEEEAEGPGAAAHPARRDSPPGCRAAPAPDLALLSDRELLLRRLIGAGRMGKVYQARWDRSEVDVAVKFLRKSYLPHPDVVRRFLGEASTVGDLEHPNIVGTHGLGRTAGGSYFIVMDLVAGPDLARRAAESRIAEGEAIAWTTGLCRALAHAHARGVIHCDLKPANLLLDPSGRIRVADFGLARSLDGDTARFAEIEGTAPFMAPEQVSRSWGPIDRRTDVFGVGAVLFALLTGRAPHAGRRLPDILAEVVAATPVISPARLRPGLTGPLVDLCRRCLSKRPGDRYQTVEEVLAALVTVRGGPPGSPGRQR